MPVPTMDNSNAVPNGAPESEHHLPRSDGLSENMILVQVNAGETFTIEDDGTYRSIPGPAQVPMVFDNGAIPTINVPPGYISQVIEENGVRKVVVLPSAGAPTLEGQPAILAHHHYHPLQPYHTFLPSPVQPAIFPVIPTRPDGMQFVPPAAYYHEESHPDDSFSGEVQVCPQCSLFVWSHGFLPHIESRLPLEGLTESSLSSPNHSTHSNNYTAMHPAGSPQARSISATERLAKKLHESKQKTQSQKNSSPDPSSLTSSPSSSSSFVPSQSASPDSHHSPYSNGHPAGSSIINFSPEQLVQHPLAQIVSASPHGHLFPIQLIAERKKMSEDLKESSNDIKLPDSLTDGCSTLSELLSSISKPKVLEVKARRAHLVWPPISTQNQKVTDELRNSFDGNVLTFELNLSCQKKTPGKFEVVYSGKERFHQLTDLKPATEYCAKVLAVCDGHRGQPSELVTFHTLSCEPDPPAPPKLANRTKNAMLLKWSAPTDNGEKIIKYHLEWDEGNHGGGFQMLFSSSQKQYKVTKLSPAHSYKFRLAAENKSGTSHWSTEVSYQTAGTVPGCPDAPRLVKATVKSLSLEWLRASGDVTSFTLEMDEESGYGFRPVYNGLDTKFVVKGLARSSHYKFRLCCNNNEGRSKWSPVISYVTCPDKPQPPGKPRVKGSTHPKFFKLTWDAPRDNGGAEVLFYTMEMSRERNRPMKVVYTGPEQECLVEEDVEPGHTYRLRVFCSTNGGASLPSEMVMVTTPPVTPGPCDAPMIALRPKPTCLTVKWEPPHYAGGTNVSLYEVSCAVAGGDEDHAEPDGAAPAVAYKGADQECTVGSLKPGTQYSFRVRPTNKVGVGPWSESLVAMTSAGTPEKVDLPVATVLSATSVHLQWQSPADNGAEIIGYRIQWGSTENAMSVVTVGPVLSHHFHCLTPNTTYLFTVQAVNAVGQGAVSEVGTVITPPSCPERVINLRHAVTDLGCDGEDEDGVEEVGQRGRSGPGVQWDAPCDNGCEITGYTVHVAEQRSRAQRKETEDGGAVADDAIYQVQADATVYFLEDLKPDTQYSVKVCAVNEIGCGSFSEPIQVLTRPLPPDAPTLSCVQATANSLRLKWGDGKGSVSGSVQYLLQIREKHGRFSTVYRGSSCSHKIHRLNEDTTYRFRINASNSEGEGQFSSEFAATTSVQMPPSIDAPSVNGVQSTSCEINWQKVEPIKGDVIQYRLSLENVDDPTIKMEQTCESCRYLLDRLTPDTEYRLRVATVRPYRGTHASQHQATDTSSNSSEDGDEPSGASLLQSTFSAGAVFRTPAGEAVAGTPRLTPRGEESPAADVAATVEQRRATVAHEQIAQRPPEFAAAAAAESISENKLSAILLAFYLLSAILMSFAAQVFVVQ